MNGPRRIAQFLAALTILMLSCDLAVTLPTAPTVPAPVGGVVQTIIVQTAGAAASQTAALFSPTPTPSVTPPPTHTAAATPTLTPTFIFRLATSTPVTPPTSEVSASETESSGNLGCTLISQSPNDGSHYSAKAKFTVTWRVKNTGADVWRANNVDFAYISGAKMYETSLYDLVNNVRVDSTLRLDVDMVAPKTSGTYTTVWALREGGNEFCQVDLKIVVP